MAWITSLPNVPALHAFDAIDSTNKFAKEIAGQAEHYTLVIAKRQTAGRGRSAREWISEEGNVYWTAILKPTEQWPSAGTLPFVAALGVHKALANLTGKPERLSIKWPNDTLLDGKKICGILQESSNLGAANSWVVTGIGINVAHYPDNPLYPAASLWQTGYKNIARDDVIAELTETYLDVLNDWIFGGYKALEADLLSRIAGIGKPIAVRKTKDETVSGIFEGLDESGFLLLRKDDGAIERIVVGDLFL